MKHLKKLLAVVLTFVFVVTALAVETPTAVYAAKTESLTMFVGESFSYSLYTTTITKVTSSDKSIVKASKDSDLKFALNLTAKKKGTATITIKYKDIKNKSQSTKIKVTVKKADIACNMEPLADGYVLFTLNNKTKQTFDKAYIKYDLKDSNGDTVKSEEDVYVTDLVAGKTAYYEVYVGKDADIDYSASKVSVTALTHDPNYTYTVCTSKNIAVTAKDETEDDSKVTFTIKQQNKTKQTVDGKYYILIYDADDNIIGMDYNSIYLTKKETKTASYETSISKRTYPTYDHYKIVVQAYYTQKK
jgi:hypothetical protein